MSNNVYEGMDVADPGAMNAKAELAARIYVAIDQRGLSRAAAAELLGMSRAKLAKILRGDFQDISAPALVDCLNRLGHDVEIVVKPLDHEPSGPGRTSVTAA